MGSEMCIRDRPRAVREFSGLSPSAMGCESQGCFATHRSRQHRRVYCWNVYPVGCLPGDRRISGDLIGDYLGLRAARGRVPIRMERRAPMGLNDPLRRHGMDSAVVAPSILAHMRAGSRHSYPHWRGVLHRRSNLLCPSETQSFTYLVWVPRGFPQLHGGGSDLSRRCYWACRHLTSW